MTLRIPRGHYDRSQQWADYSRHEWVTYEVITDDVMLGPIYLEGLTMCHARIIILRTGTERETLLHETMHAVACELGLDTEQRAKGHEWIYRLSPGLALTLAHNPALIKWLSQ